MSAERREPAGGVNAGSAAEAGKLAGRREGSACSARSDTPQAGQEG